MLCILPEVPKNELPDPFEWDRRFGETGYNVERRGVLPSIYPWLLDLITSDRAPFSFIQRFEEPVYKAVDCFGCFFCQMQCVDPHCVRKTASFQLHAGTFTMLPKLPVFHNNAISAPQYAKKRPDPVAALPIIHHFTLAAILTSVSIFFPFNVYKTLPLFHVSTFSLAVASSCPPPFVLGAGR